MIYACVVSVKTIFTLSAANCFHRNQESEEQPGPKILPSAMGETNKVIQKIITSCYYC